VFFFCLFFLLFFKPADKLTPANEKKPESIDSGSNSLVSFRSNSEKSLLFQQKNLPLTEISCNELPDDLLEELTFEQRNKVNNWFSKRGYWQNINNFSENREPAFDFSDYATYDKETLVQLALQNDGKANLVLAYQLQNSPPVNGNINDYIAHQNEVIEYALDAAIAGYSAPIFILQSANTSIFLRSKNKANHSVRHYAIVAYAWHKIGKKRNDFQSIIMGGMYLPNIELTSKEQLEIELFTKNMYNEMESRRSKRGLASFDNTYPDIFEKYYQCQKSSEQ